MPVRNSAEAAVQQTAVLYGLHWARDAVRNQGGHYRGGYFDLLACHSRMQNVVAVSGTALTEQHVKLLKRSADTAVLCLDQDRAGRDASERAFLLLAREGFQVQAVTLEAKDPDEAALAQPDVLKQILLDGGMPYLDFVLEDMKKGDTSSVQGKRAILQRLLPLLDVLASSVEQGHYIARIAAAIGATETAVRDDLKRLPRFSASVSDAAESTTHDASDHFSPIEITRSSCMRSTVLCCRTHPRKGFEFALYGHQVRSCRQD